MSPLPAVRFDRRRVTGVPRALWVGSNSDFNMAEKHALDRSDSYAEGGCENGSFKRQRVDSGAAEGYEQRSYQNSEGRNNPHYTEPSPVIHVRGIADEAREQDLLHALSSFGTIR